MNRTFFIKAASVATLSIALVANSAQAQDRLNFNGNAQVRDPSGGGGSTLLIDFLANGTTAGPGGTVTAIETINGVFMPEIMVGTQGQISDLIATTAGFSGLPQSLLTIGGYTFTLTSSTQAPGFGFGPIALTQIGNTTFATFSVNGTVRGGDFGATTRNFTGGFSAQFAGETPQDVFNDINSGNTRAVAFSAEFVVAPQQVIPEPSTYALLATGIGALGLVARRRRNQA